ncbi:hypothetical protein [Yinghuangia sp. YIM S10712]|uniref:hypothetical protein n=1 Tax=Yinghuangia sp. YIM S10712 TaxID=3436930 RepID=UPI003F538A1D
MTGTPDDSTAKTPARIPAQTRAGTPAVHVNSLRWFVEREGGAEFVRSHGDDLHDEAVARALAAAYPEVLQVLETLAASGVGADCWFAVDDVDTAVAATAATTKAVEALRAAGSAPGPSLGGLHLSVGDVDRGHITAHAAVTGLTCTGPHDDAIARAAVALTGAFGPQVVWDDALADVMLVDAGMTPAQVRARWRSGGTRPGDSRPAS